MIIKVDVAYQYGETVYLKTDTDQLPRMVTGYVLRLDSVIYYLSCGTSETMHYDIEITSEKLII